MSMRALMLNYKSSLPGLNNSQQIMVENMLNSSPYNCPVTNLDCKSCAVFININHGNVLASNPGRRGERTAWYLLYAHALKFT